MQWNTAHGMTGLSVGRCVGKHLMGSSSVGDCATVHAPMCCCMCVSLSCTRAGWRMLCTTSLPRSTPTPPQPSASTAEPSCWSGWASPQQHSQTMTQQLPWTRGTRATSSPGGCVRARWGSTRQRLGTSPGAWRRLHRTCTWHRISKWLACVRSLYGFIALGATSRDRAGLWMPTTPCGRQAGQWHCSSCGPENAASCWHLLPVCPVSHRRMGELCGQHLIPVPGTSLSIMPALPPG